MSSSSVRRYPSRYPSRQEQPDSELTARTLRALRRATKPDRAYTPQTGNTNVFKRPPPKQVASSPTVTDKPSKKARTLEKRFVQQPAERSHYEMRSTAARIGAAHVEKNSSSSSVIASAEKSCPTISAGATATVTPAAPRRQIDFRQSDVSVPAGVVNIYPGPEDESKCLCPTQPQRTTLGSCSLGNLFLVQYGPEQLEAIREKENREFPWNDRGQRSKLSPSQNSPASSLTSAAQTDQEQDDEDGDLITSLLTHTTDHAGALFLESNEDTFDSQPLLTPRMRAVLVSWLLEVGMEFNISDTAFHLAVSILDALLRAKKRGDWQDIRFWVAQGGAKDNESDDISPWERRRNRDKKWIIKKEDLQAIGCACTWIACKLEDRKPPSQDDFAFISDYSVPTPFLRKLEFRICSALDFNLHRLTPFHFVNLYLRASQACSCRFCEYDHPALRHMLHYLLCLARLSAPLMDERPSQVAAAALYLARATLNIRTPRNPRSPSHRIYPHLYWSETLEHYTGYKVHEMRRSVLLIYRYQLQAEQLGVAAFDKFKETERCAVALKTARLLEELDLPDLRLKHEDWDLSDFVEI